MPPLTFAFATVVGVPNADVAACPVTFTTAPATTLTDPSAEVVTNVAGVTFAFATTLTADLYGRDDDAAEASYYHGADFSAEL